MEPSTSKPARTLHIERHRHIIAIGVVCGLHAALYVAFRRALILAHRSDPPSVPSLAFIQLPDLRSAAVAQPVIKAPQAVRPSNARSVSTPPQSGSTAAARAGDVAGSSASIDWQAEAARSAVAAAAASAARRVPGAEGRSARTASVRSTKPFPWDKAVTERIELNPGGGTLIRLNDNCALAFTPLPMLGCWLGRREANGHLFDGMNAASPADDLARGALP